MAGKKRILRTRLAIAAVLGLITTACANDRGPHPNLPKLGISAEFASRNLCGLGISPEIRLGDIPPNAATYRLRISEISTLRGPRWQGDIPATGTSIAEGIIDGFDLPCPGEKQVLTYRFEVMALASDSSPLAYGWFFASARSLPEQIETEQRQAKRGERPTVVTPRGTPHFFLQ